MADSTRDDLEQQALEACPTEWIYDLRDSIGGATDDALRAIIAGTAPLTSKQTILNLRYRIRQYQTTPPPIWNPNQGYAQLSLKRSTMPRTQATNGPVTPTLRKRIGKKMYPKEIPYPVTGGGWPLKLISRS